MAENGEEIAHKVKHISFAGRRVPILLQDINGPCPLLAIANILLLRDQLHLPPGVGEISQQRIVSMVAAYILDANQINREGTAQEYQANIEHAIHEAIHLLPKLTTGIDVNVRFDDVRRGFEFTNETAVFDLVHIDLVHGWLYDPQDKQTAAAIGKKTYNELVAEVVTVLSNDDAKPRAQAIDADMLALALQQTLGTTSSSQEEEESTNRGMSTSIAPFESQTTPSISSAVNRMLSDIVSSQFDGMRAQGRVAVELTVDEDQASVAVNIREQLMSPALSVAQSATLPVPPSARPQNDEDALHNALLAREFLETTSHQLSHAGLIQLIEVLDPHQLAVLFRNNHFSVLYKHPSQGLFLLVTDQGYLWEGDVVWESLLAVDGDTQLMTSTFTPFDPHHHAGTVSDRQPPVDVHQGSPPSMPDSDYALALQLQQEEEEARAEEEGRRAQRLADETIRRRRQKDEEEEKRRKKSSLTSDCTIM